jgi:2-polyprenyl-6-methoxyphenol hydroxylase-like FAD-dependent oxidoreductase
MHDAIDALKSSYAVVVVGARCAGAATGMLLARAGLDVLIVEQGARGADTLSTLALMRTGVLQLARWGLLDAIESAATPRIERTTFHYGGEAVEIRIKPRHGVGALYAPRRTVLDPLLADAAQAAGADVVYRVRARDIRRDAHGRVTGVLVESGGRARWIAAGIVVGADGLRSTVAERVGAAPRRVGSHASAVIYAQARGLPVDGYHWHYAQGTSVGVIPTNDAQTLIFVAAPRKRFARMRRFDPGAEFHEILRATAPSVARSIGDGPLGPYRAFAGHPGALRPARGSGWALVGDAGYFKDPITAHGISDALRDAELLARAIAKGTDAALTEFEALRDDLSLPLMAITDEIASFEWDMARLQALHKALSDEMAREAQFLADRDVPASAGAQVNRSAGSFDR